jgi:ankyrin repeat protein
MFRSARKSKKEIEGSKIIAKPKSRMSSVKHRRPLLIEKSSLLGYAVCYNSSQIVETLLEGQGDTNVIFGTTSSPILHLAISNSNTDIVRLLVDKNADVNAIDIHGRTPLMEATHCGSVSAVEFLLLRRADPTITDNWGRTAIFYVDERNETLLQLLAMISS